MTQLLNLCTIQKLHVLVLEISKSTRKEQLTRLLLETQSLCSQSLKQLDLISHHTYNEHLKAHREISFVSSLKSLCDLPHVCFLSVFSFCSSKFVAQSRRVCKTWCNNLDFTKSKLKILSLLAYPMVGSIKFEGAKHLKIHGEDMYYFNFCRFYDSKNSEGNQIISWYNFWTRDSVGFVNLERMDSKVKYIDISKNFSTRHSRFTQSNDRLVFLSEPGTDFGNNLIVQLKFNKNGSQIKKYKVSEICFSSDGRGQIVQSCGYIENENSVSITVGSCYDDGCTVTNYMDEMEKNKGWNDIPESCSTQFFEPNNNQLSKNYFKKIETVHWVGISDLYPLIHIQLCDNAYIVMQNKEIAFEIPLGTNDANPEKEQYAFVKCLAGFPIICVLTEDMWLFYTFQGYCCKKCKPLTSCYVYDVTLRRDQQDLLLFVAINGTILKFKVSFCPAN